MGQRQININSTLTHNGDNAPHLAFFLHYIQNKIQSKANNSYIHLNIVVTHCCNTNNYCVYYGSHLTLKTFACNRIQDMCRHNILYWQDHPCLMTIKCCLLKKYFCYIIQFLKIHSSLPRFCKRIVLLPAITGG